MFMVEIPLLFACCTARQPNIQDAALQLESEILSVENICQFCLKLGGEINPIRGESIGGVVASFGLGP